MPRQLKRRPFIEYVVTGLLYGTAMVAGLLIIWLVVVSTADMNQKEAECTAKGGTLITNDDARYVCVKEIK